MSRTRPEKKPYKWTVLIYMAGDNNLSEECVYSLTEIKEALSKDVEDKLAVLAQFDPAGVRAQTKRYWLGALPETLENDAAATGWTANETNTGQPQNLLDFVRWGMSQFKAERYMVVLVGHGSGTDDDFLLRDDNPPDALSILELRDIFEQLTADGHTIDILGMDTCLMNMAEVCFELLRTNVTYLVGSEGYAPNTGWPYKRILKALAEQLKDGKEVKPETLAVNIAQEYQHFYIPYINGGIAVDQAVLEVKKIEEVKKRMFSLMGTLLDELDDPKSKYGTCKPNALVLAHWETQSYNGEVFVDLYDFCECLKGRYEKLNKDVADKCQAVQDAIESPHGLGLGLVKTSRVAGAAFQFSHGVSIYFPWAVRSAAYGNLAFPRETRWLDFLDLYHTKTRRDGRTDPNEIEPPPVRAAVPTNKGRSGNVESMRNPPTKEFITPDPKEQKPKTVTVAEPPREVTKVEPKTKIEVKPDQVPV